MANTNAVQQHADGRIQQAVWEEYIALMEGKGYKVMKNYTSNDIDSLSDLTKYRIHEILSE